MAISSNASANFHRAIGPDLYAAWFEIAMAPRRSGARWPELRPGGLRFRGCGRREWAHRSIPSPNNSGRHRAECRCWVDSARRWRGLPSRTVAELVGGDFDGDIAAQAGIEGAPYFAHAALAGRRDDFVEAEFCAGLISMVNASVQFQPPHCFSGRDRHHADCIQPLLAFIGPKKVIRRTRSGETPRRPLQYPENVLQPLTQERGIRHKRHRARYGISVGDSSSRADAQHQSVFPVPVPGPV